MANRWGNSGRLFFWPPQSLKMVIAAMKLIDAYSLEWKLWQPRQHIKKQRHYFVNKGLSSQDYGLSSSHVRMWELDYKESWVLKNWCFWSVVLEKILESPLDFKEIKPFHPKRDQSWMFTGRTAVEAELQYFGHLMQTAESFEKTLMLEDWGQEEKRTTEDEMVGWHHQLNGHEFG